MNNTLLKTLLSCLVQPGRYLHSARPQTISQSPSNSSSASDDGLTLLECVVAIAVIALTGAMIGPPLVLAAATRVQNRRAEQALQLAQGEVDRIRAMVVQRDSDLATKLPALVDNDNLEEHGAPTQAVNKLRSPDSACNSYDATSDVSADDEALPIDVDGDCTYDFLVQTFRQNLDRAGDVRDFQLMVRVYAAKAASNFGSLGTEPASLQFTSGSGKYGTAPLAILTTRVNQSDTDAALCGYHGLNTADEDGADDGDC